MNRLPQGCLLRLPIRNHESEALVLNKPFRLVRAGCSVWASARWFCFCLSLSARSLSARNVGALKS